jgi:molybdate transport system substrate-binding protein
MRTLFEAKLFRPALSLLTLVLFVSCSVLSGCRSVTPPQDELVVSAAVSLKNAFNEIAQIYERRTGVKIGFNFGASGALQKQIEAGAPIDIFASAGAKQMDELATENLIVASSRRDFARNVLILIQPAAGELISSFEDLRRDDVKKIAIGNPKTVPAGQYAAQALERLKLLPAIQSKLIYGEDVRQALDYVVRGEVDAGIVYASDAMIEQGKVKTIARAPEESHDQILYPIAIVKDSRRADSAQKFIELVLSAEGQSILAKHGFVSIK